MRPLHKDQVIDRYHLVRYVGGGFTGEVWEARVLEPLPNVPLEVGDCVALKFYKFPELKLVDSIRIQREFGIAGRIRHRSLPKVFDLSIRPSLDWHTFLVMKFFDGQSLKSRIESHGRLSPEETIHIATEVLHGLNELHAAGAIHRDVKAANIILIHDRFDFPPQVKLVDLGIVSIDSTDNVTHYSAFMGSKHSAPLEQLTGKRIDKRADIYGLGSVMFHSLLGRPPYHGAGPEGAIVHRMLTDPERIDVHEATSEPEALMYDFVNRCLSVNRDARPHNVMQCLQSLHQIRSLTDRSREKARPEQLKNRKRREFVLSQGDVARLEREGKIIPRN